MVLGLTLSVLGLLGLVGIGAKKASDSVSGASLSSVSVSPSEIDTVLENSKNFTDKYLSDDVLNVDSNEPYISSPEISRPVLGGGNKDDRRNGKIGYIRSFGVGYLVSDVLDGVKTVAQNVDSLIPFLFFVLGGYVVYKVVD